MKALDSYQKAEKLSHHECPECLIREIKIYKTAGDFGAALDCAKKAQKQAGADKIETANALMVEAALLAAQTSKPKDKKLVQAVTDTREAMTLDPALTLAHFNLGVLLIRQNQDSDGIAELKSYLALPNLDAATVKAAREDIADPRRAREPFAPEFAFTTLENEQVSLASLHGKVALLDFWGSWCPPCRASIPTVALLQKDFARKGVEFVGISSDTDANAWRSFIAANHMVWPEYLDSDDRVQSAFQIDSFPTYIVLDRNGVIQFRQSGFDQQESPAELYGALDRALKVKLDPSAPPVASAATGANSAAQTSSSPAQSGAAPATTSSYGYPEPTYARTPPAVAPPANAPGAWANGLGIGIRVATPTNEVNFSAFGVPLIRQLKGAWRAPLPPAGIEGKQGPAVELAVVKFSVDRDGRLTGPPSLDRSSGDASFDQGALADVLAAAPFPAFPTGFSGATVEVQALFTYSQHLPQPNK